MKQYEKNTDYTDTLLELATKHGAFDRIAAYHYCIEKEWLCGYGRVTDKGFHEVTANICTDTTAA
jgi:hypothetical protein